MANKCKYNQLFSTQFSVRANMIKWCRRVKIKNINGQAAEKNFIKAKGGCRWSMRHLTQKNINA